MFDRHTLVAIAFNTWLLASLAVAIEPSHRKPEKVREVAGTSVKFAEPPELTLPEEIEEIEGISPPPAEENVYVPPTQGSEPIAKQAKPACKSCDCCKSRKCKKHHGGLKHCYWDAVGYPGAYSPAPFGASFNACFDTQIANGLAAQMILYRYDFQQPEIDLDPTQLISHGRLRLSRMSMAIVTAPTPLIIESTGNPSLDKARRRNVLSALQRMVPVPVSPDTVVTAVPEVRGLNGNEALEIDANLMQQTANRGLSTLPSVPGQILSPVQSAPAVAVPISE